MKYLQYCFIDNKNPVLINQAYILNVGVLFGMWLKDEHLPQSSVAAEFGQTQT